MNSTQRDECHNKVKAALAALERSPLGVVARGLEDLIKYINQTADANVSLVNQFSEWAGGDESMRLPWGREGRGFRRWFKDNKSDLKVAGDMEMAKNTIEEALWDLLNPIKLVRGLPRVMRSMRRFARSKEWRRIYRMYEKLQGLETIAGMGDPLATLEEDLKFVLGFVKELSRDVRELIEEYEKMNRVALNMPKEEARQARFLAARSVYGMLKLALDLNSMRRSVAEPLDRLRRCMFYVDQIRTRIWLHRAGHGQVIPARAPEAYRSRVTVFG